jgi:hypothetical protein
MTCVNPDCPTSFVNHAIDAKPRLNHGGNSFAFFMNSIAVKQAGANTCTASPGLKIKGEHMCRLDCASGRESRADRFPASAKAREIVEPNSANNDDMRKISQ